ncbi:hypothetical protein TNCV_1202001 [Trichonephila clavipes]|nr:hypothetical protein TNCV_1202001 [Trichonephila clavipes]
MHTGRLELQLSLRLFINPINISELLAQDKSQHEEQRYVGCGSQASINIFYKDLEDGYILTAAKFIYLKRSKEQNGHGHGPVTCVVMSQSCV